MRTQAISSIRSKLTEVEIDIRRGRSQDPTSVLVHTSPFARQSRPINGICLNNVSQKKKNF